MFCEYFTCTCSVCVSLYQPLQPCELAACSKPQLAHLIGFLHWFSVWLTIYLHLGHSSSFWHLLLWWPYSWQLQKGKYRKVREEPQAEAAAQPRHKEEQKKKWHRLTCAWLTNKCTKSTKTSSHFPKQGDQNAKRTEKHIGKEQGKTKHETPRTVVLTTELHRIRTTTGPSP